MFLAHFHSHSSMFPSLSLFTCRDGSHYRTDPANFPTLFFHFFINSWVVILAPGRSGKPGTAQNAVAFKSASTQTAAAVNSLVFTALWQQAASQLCVLWRVRSSWHNFIWETATWSLSHSVVKPSPGTRWLKSNSQSTPSQLYKTYHPTELHEELNQKHKATLM